MRDPVRRATAVCPVEVAIAVIGGAWKMTAIKQLRDGPVRFGVLRRAVGPVTPRVLTRQLRELEADGVIHREIYAEVPPRVEYSLTPIGVRLGTLVEGLDAWGADYLAAADPESEQMADPDPHPGHADVGPARQTQPHG